MRARALLLILLALALGLGTFARFKGLGTWPVVPDEYYIVRSVQNVLASGLPAYPCGGYYTRGLLFQYLTALTHLSGASFEFSSRFIAALASLIALPAAYLLARRVHGRIFGALLVALLALSVWEVETARFGRMYAPFQAVFLWYLLFFLRYTVDGERRALWPMLALTVVGTLTWEGGVFLALLNLLAPAMRDASGRLTRADGPYLIGMALLLVPVAWFVTTDPRTLGAGPALPAGMDTSFPPAAPTVHALAPLTTLARHPIWVLVALIPAAAALVSLRWIWTFRARWLVALGLLLALAAAMLHQFVAFAVILILLMLLQQIEWREIANRAALPYGLAVLLGLLFWTAFGLATADWHPATSGSGPTSGALLLARQFTRFPDFFDEIVRPWGGAVPVLFLWLSFSVAAAVIALIVRPSAGSRVERVLLSILILLAAAASASDPPRHETRYVFFLYPLALGTAILIAMRAFESVRFRVLQRVFDRFVGAANAQTPRKPEAARWNESMVRTAIGVVAAAALFMLSEDFSVHHLARIDSAAVNFRLGLEGRARAHLLPRADVRGAADWLMHHTISPDIVVNAYPSVDLYYAEFDFAYIDEQSRRFHAYACQRGTRERWGNLPLLYTESALEARIASGHRVVLVAPHEEAQRMLRTFARWRPRVAWRSIEGDVEILEFAGAGHYVTGVQAPLAPQRNPTSP